MCIDYLHFCTDSSIALLWLRATRVQFEARIQTLISKGQLYLYSNNLSSFFHLQWFHQKQAKYLPDFLTKVNLDTESVEGLCKKMNKLRDFSIF